MDREDKLYKLLKKITEGKEEFDNKLEDVNLTRYSFENLLLKEAFDGHISKNIIANRDYAGYIFEYTPLILACQSGNTDLVKCLIKNGADVNKTGRIYEMTPLTVACIKNKGTIIKKLIGDNLNKRGMFYEISPLIVACINDDEALVDLLTNVEGIDINKEVEFKSGTPLAFACEEGYNDIAQLLIKQGANPHKPVEIFYENALSIVVDKNYTRLERLLLNFRAHVSKKAERFGEPLDIAKEKENFELVTCLEKQEVTCSHHL